MGKYSAFRNQLTKFTEEPSHQEKVNEMRAKILADLKLTNDEPTMFNLGYVLVQARLEKARLEARVKEENLKIEAMTQVLVDKLESEDYTSLKLTNGVSLTIKDDVYCSVSDKVKFYDWIEETSQQDLLTVNYQTMSALTKTLLIDGKEAPPGVSTTFKQGITVRGAKGLSDV